MADFLVLAAARWLHFGAAMILFGSSLFQIYSLVPARRTQKWQRAVALLACASGLVWMSASLVAMTGEVESLDDPGTLSAFFAGTQFGAVWDGWLLIAAVTTALVFTADTANPKGRVRPALIALASGSLLVIEAWLGHAASGSTIGAWPPVLAYATHVLAAGAWLGALPALTEIVAAPIELRAVHATLTRFSRIGMASVAVILLSGIANTLFRISSLPQASTTAFGRVVAIKIVLLVLLFGLAAQNRLQALPRLCRGTDGGPALAILKRNMLLEHGLGALVLLAAAFLGLLSPTG